MNKRFVFAFMILVLLSVFISGCGKPKLYSKWRNRQITIDGKFEDWQNDIAYYDENTRVSIGVINDDTYLYICLITRNRGLMEQLMRSGFNVWFDPEGGSDKVFGIHFPLGMQGGGMSIEAGGGNSVFSDKKDLKERYENNDVKPCDDLYDIEEIAFIIKDLTHKVDIQKEYKKKRVDAINNEINILQNKINYFKKVIAATLEKNKEKNLTLPDVCKVNLRKPVAKWIIDDEESLIGILIEEKEIANCAEKVEGWKIVKKELDKILNDWEKSENLPVSVHKEMGEIGVTISFLDKEEKEDEPIDTTVPIKEEDFDELEF